MEISSNILRACMIGFLFWLSASLAIGQYKKMKSLDPLIDKYGRQSLQEYYDLLSIANDANYPEQLTPNIRWLEKAFTKRGFQTQQLKTPAIPILFAEKRFKNAKKTVLIYLQVDGQPVDTSKWFQETPYTPTLKKMNEKGAWEIIPWKNLQGEIDPDWRIFARAASDAKGPINMFLASLDIIEEAKITPNFNIKVIMDCEEELGSPNLPAAVEKYKETLKSDMFIILDGPRHILNQPTLQFGARGIATITLTVFGPRAPQHSGHYGNYAPNPAFQLSKLLASMKDDRGKVTIPGYYDGIVLNDKIRATLKQVPDDETLIKNKLGIAKTDNVGSTYQESIQYPSLNIRGMSSGWVGKESRTIIPDKAIAEIDVRLVKESDPKRLITLIKDHVSQQGFHFVNGTPTEEERRKYGKLISFTHEISYAAFRTDFDTEIGEWLTRAMRSTFGKDPIKIRTAGGSIPISPFIETLDIPAVGVPAVNSDNNQHSPNENLRLGNYFEGIKTFVGILAEPVK